MRLDHGVSPLSCHTLPNERAAATGSACRHKGRQRLKPPCRPSVRACGAQYLVRAS
ncbi:hypothetical protein FOMPIDRAFT_1026435 [Fomitopsis schrenkii]|uniref:Uncharacterized protein n=1 Tax=Fomitopsis schrenkii TaxID=2126942 RepID=S8DMA1_FOMSC|nr:hypothetical protein FOMPIDRAFT_1026435 [Fomitopsis schrenkii]